jgi:hypothetical protein
MSSKPLLEIALFFIWRLLSAERIWTKQSTVAGAISFKKDINPNAKFLSQNAFPSEKYYSLADKYQVTNPVIVQKDFMAYFVSLCRILLYSRACLPVWGLTKGHRYTFMDKRVN